MRFPCRCFLSLATLALLASVAAAQRDLKNIPSPDPELERKTFVVPEGFEVNLFAADPKIAKPIQMNFDADGRLWIASSEVYPHIKPGQEATDKILVLDDTNNDGVADETVVFANGLLIPTGVLPDDEGGAYVANSTELIHLQDTNGDRKADRRRVALSGFGTEDTHHLLHTLRWGHDGAIYMNQSIYIHSHVETPTGVKRLNGGGIWRYKPAKFQLDILCRGFVNPWGHHFDQWGQSFVTDGAYGEGINYVFPGAVYVTAVGAKRRLQGLNPGSPKHCGLEIVSGRHLPEDWRGSMITNDFRAHRVCRFIVSEDGSGYASRQAQEVIKSTHVAFRPIDVKMGPDGAIYIADWYNPIIQHGEVDFRDPRRDHVHGRIWRVAAKNRPTTPRRNLREASTAELLERLGDPEEWVRLHAKLLLRSRGADSVAPSVDRWLASLDPQDAATKHLQLEALWLYEALNQPRIPLLRTLLASDDHRVRAAAVRMAVNWKASLDKPLDIFARAAGDNHGRVRLEAVRALATIQSPQAATAALRVLEQSMDRFLDFALWQCMRDLEGQWLPLAKTGEFDFGGSVAKLTFALKSVDSPDVATPLVKLLKDDSLSNARRLELLSLLGGLGGPAELQQALDLILQAEANDDDRAAWLEQLVFATRARKVKPAGDLGKLSTWVRSENRGLREATIRAAGAWKISPLRPEVNRAADDKQASTRVAAINALASYADDAAGDRLVRFAKQDSWSDRRIAIAGLARFQPRRASNLAARSIADAPDETELIELLRPVLQRKEGPAALSGELANVSLKADQAKVAIRVARRLGAPDNLVESLRKAGKLDTAAWKLTPELKQQLVQEVADHGDPQLGEQVFRRSQLQCLKCHGVGGSGGRVGPDLLSLGASAQVDYLIESMIAPNAKVKENFHAVIVQTDAGKVLTGIPVRQTDRQLVIRDAEDREVAIPVDSIEQRKDSRSLMPDGTIDTLTRDELRDLVRFLSELGKSEPFSIGKEPLVRTWRLLLPTQQALHRIRRTSFDTAATDDPAFQWQSVYSQVNGQLPVRDLIHFNAPTYVTRKDSVKTIFLRASVEVTQPGRVAIDVGDPTGLQVWNDGKPMPVSKIIKADWDRGVHHLTIAVDKVKRSTNPLRFTLVEDATTAQARVINGK